MITKRKMGPGVLITSAFIGPGTVTICLLSGVASGLTLLWAVIFSTVATIILQDMCVRLGYFGRRGLEESIISKINIKPLSVLTIILIGAAIVIGNAAYESGNISGTQLGLDMMGLSISKILMTTCIFVFCLLCILNGNYDLIKNLLSIMVVLMSITFITIAIIQFPSMVEFLEGCFIPKVEAKNLFLIMGLIGTTVVPYNLFLHTNLVSEQHSMDIKALRIDSVISILIGGLISMAIVIIGSHARGMQVGNASEMAAILSNTVGVYSKYLLGLGLCCAGLSSALTAPMAAALVAAGLLGWRKNFTDIKLKAVQIFVLTIGYFVSISGLKTIEIIKMAQVLNGLLLPLFAGFLIWVLNDRMVMKVHKNSSTQNLLALFVVIVTIILAIKSVI